MLLNYFINSLSKFYSQSTGKCHFCVSYLGSTFKLVCLTDSCKTCLLDVNREFVSKKVFAVSESVRENRNSAKRLGHLKLQV